MNILISRVFFFKVEVEPCLFDQYYNGCCNETYWPLFHSMPDRAIFRSDYWAVSICFLNFWILLFFVPLALKCEIMVGYEMLI